MNGKSRFKSDSEKGNEVYDILLTPIICDKDRIFIKKEDGIIYSGQMYNGMADPDMCDFAVGFYEVLYARMLGGESLLNGEGELVNRAFAGDTMNTFNTIANVTPGAGRTSKLRTPEGVWPEILRTYWRSYHCLANFWLIPMKLGRMSNKSFDPEIWGDGKPIDSNEDYMDRFLRFLYLNVRFNGTDREFAEYFHYFGSFMDFCHGHYLDDGYVKGNGYIIPYSYENYEAVITQMMDSIKMRARRISESPVALELWEYFYDNDLTGRK